MAHYTIRATQDESVYCQTFKTDDPDSADRTGRRILADAWDIDLDAGDHQAKGVDDAVDTVVVDPSPEIDDFMALLDAAKALIEGTSDNPFEDLRRTMENAERHRSMYD